MAVTEEKRWAERQDIYESLKPHADRNFLRELQASNKGLVAIFCKYFPSCLSHEVPLPFCSLIPGIVHLSCHFIYIHIVARLIFPRPDGKNSRDAPLPLSSSMGDHLWSAAQQVLEHIESWHRQESGLSGPCPPPTGSLHIHLGAVRNEPCRRKCLSQRNADLWEGTQVSVHYHFHPLQKTMECGFFPMQF